MQTTIDDNTILIKQLESLGVHHLRAISKIDDVSPLEPIALITQLSQHPDPRFREALIPLFLRQTHLAETIVPLLPTLGELATDTTRHMYTAVVYLQRLWWGALGYYINNQVLLPDYFGKEYFGLPGPEVYFGEVGLKILAEKYQKQTGYNWLSTYRSVMSLFLKQLSLEVLQTS